MIPTISVVDAFVNANLAFVGGKETGVNDGEFVKWIQKQTGNAPPDAWCASAQSKIGYAVMRERWPVPLIGEVKQIGDWAESKGILGTEPKLGALMLFWGEKDKRGPRFNHIGGVVKLIDSNTCGTCEGNTIESANSERVREAVKNSGFYKKTRTILGRDRFVYWWEVM